MSSTGNDTSKKIDHDDYLSTSYMENDEKLVNEATNNDNSFHHVPVKKRKLNNQKAKSIKSKSKSQNSTSGQSSETVTKETDNEPSSRKYASHSVNSTTHDIYCWICHKTENTIDCSFCPRTFHFNCVQSCFSQATNEKEDWICPECISVMVSECTLNITPRWKTISTQELNEMLLFILLRLYHISGSSHFQVPVDDQAIKDYYTIIKYPIYMDLLKEKVLKREYSSVQAFHSDFKWILHNCTVYNGAASLLTNYAKNIDKVCVKEINLLRSCPECFQQRMPFMIKLLKDQSRSSPTKLSLNNDKTWEFSAEEQSINEIWMTKLCISVHSLVWVRLHNFPVWPGKLISLDDESALVLFFGDYDLNVVPLGSICIHTQSNHKRLLANINNFSNRRTTVASPPANSVSKEYQLALEQLSLHLENIKKKYEYFSIPPKKIEFNIQAGVEYYEKIRTQSCLSNDIIVVNSIEDIGVGDDLSENAASEKHDFRLESEKSDENNSLSLYSINQSSKIKSKNESISGIPFMKSFESGMQSLLKQFKMDCATHFKLSITDEVVEDWPSRPAPLEGVFQNFKQQTDPISVSNAAVQFSSKEYETEDELRTYIKYLEKSLACAEIEVRRQEILSAIHHEENLLEFSKQQKELKKVYDNDLMEILKMVRGKFDEKFGRTVQKVKSNEWCAFCSKLARFYCCWNTCYCNQECQSKHWDMHKATCTQINRSVPPGIIPKTSYPPSTSSNIPSMMQHIIPRNGDIGLNGSSGISDFSPNVPHKQRLPIKR